MNTENKSMYENVKAINELNKVEGFDPRDYMRQMEPGDWYLDVAFRKLWFRLKHPSGRIDKRIIQLTDRYAVMEARIYLDVNDPENAYVSNGFSQKFMTEDEQFGNKFLESAETAAVGRALADAGFGLQFADKEGERDHEVADAPFDAGKIGAGENEEEYIPYPASQMTEEEELLAGYVAGQEAMVSKPAKPVQKPAKAAAKPKATEETALDASLPVEELYKKLTLAKAKKVVVPVGVHKGKTLEQVAKNNPKSLGWYINNYNGPDNLLRAAAQYLVNAAEKAA